MKTGKLIGLIMLVGGIIMFVVFNEQTEKYRELIETGSMSKKIDIKHYAESGSDYLFKFWLSDEETGYQWASSSADLSIYLDDELIHQKQYAASSSDDTGGVKRAQDTDEIKYKPSKSGYFYIKGELTEGDKWEVQIYKNMSDKENLAPPLALIVAVIGLVLILKNRKQVV